MIFMACNSYNLDIANVIGIRSAIYLGYVNNLIIASHTNAVKFSPEEMMSATAMSPKAQEATEMMLEDAGLLIVVRKSSIKPTYSIDYDKLQKMLDANSPEDEWVEQANKRKRTKDRVESSSEYVRNLGISRGLKGRVKTKNEDVRNAYFKWIDAIMAKGKYHLTAESIEVTEQELSKYSDIPSIQIDVLNEAIKMGWTNISWAISSYDKNRPKDSGNNFVSYNDIKFSGEERTNEAF